jgi:hypothetical protein
MEKEFIKKQLRDIVFTDYDRVEHIYDEHLKTVKRNNWRWFGVFMLLIIIFIGCVYEIKKEDNYKYESFKSEMNCRDSVVHDSLCKFVNKNKGFTIDSASMAKFMLKHSNH